MRECRLLRYEEGGLIWNEMGFVNICSVLQGCRVSSMKSVWDGAAAAPVSRLSAGSALVEAVPAMPWDLTFPSSFLQAVPVPFSFILLHKRTFTGWSC